MWKSNDFAWNKDLTCMSKVNSRFQRFASENQESSELSNFYLNFCYIPWLDFTGVCYYSSCKYDTLILKLKIKDW